jgi:hypothetical protein
VERSADSTLIDRESGAAGTPIEATAESRFTADPNSARSDLETSAIVAGTDSDNGRTDRPLVRVIAWLIVVFLLVTNAKSAKSAKSGIGWRDPAAHQQTCSKHAGACEKTHDPLRHDAQSPRKQLLHRHLSMCDSATTSTRRHIDVAPVATQLLGTKQFVAEFKTYSTYASAFAEGLAPMPSLGIVPTWHPVITATLAMPRRSLRR